VPETSPIPSGYNLTDSNAMATGGVIDSNDVRGSVEASISAADVAAGSVSLSAVENAILNATTDSSATASGGSAFGDCQVIAVNGLIATKQSLSEAAGSVVDSDLTSTAGNILVDARNTSTMDAT